MGSTEAVVTHARVGFGGAEQVLISVGRVLRHLGFRTTLLTTQVQSWKGLDSFNRVAILPFPYVRFSKTIDALLSERRARSLESRSLVINTTPLYGPTAVGDVLYIHFPYFVAELLESRRMSDKLLGNFLLLIQQWLHDKEPSSRRLLFNSKYSLEATRRAFPALFGGGSYPIVLYPPVDSLRITCSVKAFHAHRKNLVLTLSRISKDKSLENVLSVASSVRDDVNFVIGGYVESASYFRDFGRKISASGLSDKVKLVPNLTEAEKLELLAEASVYFHPKRGEHFGIAIVEAMAAGVIPIAWKEGGTNEILPSDLLFSSIDDAALLVQRHVTFADNTLTKYLARESGKYDVSIFEERLSEIILNTAGSS